jgi:hypothetical protein
MTGRTVPASYNASPGNYIPSALWNTQITNGLYSFCFNPPYFKGIATTTQSIASGGTWAALTMTAAITDTESGWSSGSPTVYTVQTAGRYLILATVTFPSATSTDTSPRGIGIWQNGSSVRVKQTPANSSAVWENTCEMTVFCNVGDTISMYASNGYSSALSTVVAQSQQQPCLEMIWLGAH